MLSALCRIKSTFLSLQTPHHFTRRWGRENSAFRSTPWRPECKIGQVSCQHVGWWSPFLHEEGVERRYWANFQSGLFQMPSVPKRSPEINLGLPSCLWSRWEKQEKEEEEEQSKIKKKKKKTNKNKKQRKQKQKQKQKQNQEQKKKKKRSRRRRRRKKKKWKKNWWCRNS